MGFSPSPSPNCSGGISPDSLILPSTAVVNPITGLENFPPLISSSVSKNGSGFLKSQNFQFNQGNCEINSPEVVTIINGKSGEAPQIEAFGDNSIDLNPNPKAWRSLFPMPKPITPRSSMKFTSPVDVNGKLVVAATSDKFAAGIKCCEDRVVGFFVGKRLSFTAVQLAVNKLWKFKKKVTIKLYGECAYIFEFSDEDDRKLVLETGSFYIGKHFFILRPWSLLLEKSVTDVKSVPIWVLIHGVPLHLWNNDGLSLISSYLGIPILADDCTLNQTRLAYAKICVEIDIDFAYPDSIPLLVDGKYAMDLPVEYQWKPPKCVSCNVFGHSEVNCTRKLKTRWVPKNKNSCSHFRTVAGVLDEGIASISKGTMEVAAMGAGERTVENSTEISNNSVSIPSSSNPISNSSSGEKSFKDIDANETSIREVVGLSAMNGLTALDGKSVGPTSRKTTNEALVGAPGVVINKVGGQLVTSGIAQVSFNSPAKGANKKGGDAAGYKSTPAVVIPKVAVGVNTISSLGPIVAKKVEMVPSLVKTTASSIISNSKAQVIEKGDQEGWTKVQGKKKGFSPKKNPFMVFSDFTKESRFPINKVGAAEKTSSSRPKSFQDSGEELSDIEFEKYLKHMSCEEKETKIKDRELRRVKWNRKNGFSK